MITGFNTDVDYEGRVFHVQTEDKGRDNPVVESLVYSGGEIVASRRASYAELARSESYSEAEVLKRMEAQHQILIRDIRNGRFDPEGPRPFGAEIVTNRSLDEVILDFLAQEATVERIRLEVAPQAPLREGTNPSVRFRVLAETSGLPLPGAKVAVKMISTLDRARDLFAGETNPEGWVDATLELPLIPEGNSALLCQAQLGDSSAEVQHLVVKHGIELGG